jgi:hypothetical protein
LPGEKLVDVASAWAFGMLNRNAAAATAIKSANGLLIRSTDRIELCPLLVIIQLFHFRASLGSNASYLLKPWRVSMAS